MRYIIFILFVSCTTERQAVKYFDAHQDVAGNYCTGKFPITPIIDTIIIQYDSTAFDAAYNEVLKFADSLINLPKDTSYVHDTLRIKERVRVSLAPCKEIIKTVVRTVENTARIKALEAENKKLSEQVYHLGKKGNERLLVIFGLVAFLVLLLAMMTRRWR